jgi:hypothetical protein
MAIGQIKLGDERIPQHIAQHHHLAIVNHRRTGKSPLCAGHKIVTGLHRAEVLFPQKLSLAIKTEQSFRAENGHDAFSIGGGRRIAMGRFGMAFTARNAFITQRVPYDFARDLFQGEQAPLMRFLIIGRCDVTIKPHFHVLVVGANRRGDVKNISPNDGRRMRQAGN